MTAAQELKAHTEGWLAKTLAAQEHNAHIQKVG